jgi:hypothetical protein
MAAVDTFSTLTTGGSGPASNAFEISPNNDAELTYVTRWLYVGTAGHVKIDTAGGETVTLNNLAAGVLHPIRAKKVYATGTTALTPVGFY